MTVTVYVRGARLCCLASSCSAPHNVTMTIRRTMLATLLTVALSASAGAQLTRHQVAVAWRPASAQAETRLPPPPHGYWELRALSRYAGWGGAIGATGGLIWALADRSDSRFSNALDTVAYPVVGFAAGLVGGAVVYVVHEAVSR